ncbi:hypothetical protein RIF29_21270 [Crotalaria pallida]|uniref:Uncharacterized protein n=1 Tax=Crotalaria pallida TaxID=3830 RepID=A0AAN9I892_CROPI
MLRLSLPLTIQLLARMGRLDFLYPTDMPWLVAYDINLNETVRVYDLASMSCKPESHKVVLAFASSLSCIFLLILGFGFLMWWRQRYNKQIFFDVNEQNREEVYLGNLKKFHFRELQVATNNFCNKNLVAKGGFGNVYKGYLLDGLVVAVKMVMLFYVDLILECI